jgi:hypothetical protein
MIGLHKEWASLSEDKRAELVRQFEEVPKRPSVRVRDRAGYIYVAQVREFVKIGYTTRPGSRFWNFRNDAVKRPVALPRGGDWLLESVMIGPGSLTLERSIHLSLARFRVAGTNEWYYRDDEVMEFLRRYPLQRIKVNQQRPGMRGKRGPCRLSVLANKPAPTKFLSA